MSDELEHTVARLVMAGRERGGMYMATVELGPDDLRLAARICADALTPAVERDWSVPAGDLDWDAAATLDHVLDVLGFYAVHLAARATSHLPFATGSLVVLRERTPVPGLLAAMEALAAVLADVVGAAPPTGQAYHPWGTADPLGFVAMGCDEMLIHTADIAQGLGVPFRPPEELVARVLARLFPWTPGTGVGLGTGADVGTAWATLLWANGRAALPDHPRLGPEWRWWCAPLEEWRGFVRIGGATSESHPVSTGDAVLWPARLDQRVWTEDEPLAAVVIDGPAEREEAH